MNCWDAVWYHIFHPSASFTLPNLDKKSRKLSLPPPPSSTSAPASADSEAPESEKLDTHSHEVSTSTTTTTLSEKSLLESPESIVPDIDSAALATTSPPIIEVRLPPRSSSALEEAASSTVRNIEVEGDAGIFIQPEDASTASDCSPVCDSGYASSAEVDEQDVTSEEAEPSPLTFIDSPVIRKHNSSFAYFEVTSTSCETIPLPLTDEFDDEDEIVYPTIFNGLPIPFLTLTPSPDEPFPEYVPIQLSYHGTYLSVPAKPCYESLVHARRALRCTIVGWWGEEPDSEDEQEHDEEGEADAEDDAEDMCVEDIVYWLEDDEEELPNLPDDW
ncbi:hypothetical protein FRC04_008407 [Tulasnella sp. 424]|nr:hypothetical protein FRC04_008407 [Tulasnella sp. 424]